MKPTPIVVLKFGGSVLRRETDLPRCVHEIYRHWRNGCDVVAVVSAIEGTTDALLAAATRVGPERSPTTAALLATGERACAALLTLAVERAGIPVTLAEPTQIGLRASAARLDADPTSVDVDALRAMLARTPVIVLPGFIGSTDAGDTAVFGRGGSDLTALFLSQRLHARRCILVKDVCGLFEHDPHLPGPPPRQFASADWGTASVLGGHIVQLKAIQFAAANDVPFEIRGLDGRRGSTVGARRPRRIVARPTPTPLRVGLLGFGVVGEGVYRALCNLPEAFNVVGVVARARRQGLAATMLAGDVDALCARRCDVIVEAIGGLEPAGSWIARALERGVAVVTANKALVARQPATNGSRLLFSAAVGGALPAIEVVRRRARAPGLVRIETVINGTCNFVLDAIAAGADFATAVQRARAQGYTEADASSDLDGSDTVDKLLILAREAFGSPPCHWRRRAGIDGLDEATVRAATARSMVWRLVATCERTPAGVVGCVEPRCLELQHPLASVTGAGNALVLHGLDGSQEVVRGQGAGRWPTTEAIVADLLELQRQRLRTPARRRSQTEAVR